MGDERIASAPAPLLQQQTQALGYSKALYQGLECALGLSLSPVRSGIIGHRRWGTGVGVKCNPQQCNCLLYSGLDLSLFLSFLFSSKYPPAAQAASKGGGGYLFLSLGFIQILVTFFGNG